MSNGWQACWGEYYLGIVLPKMIIEKHEYTKNIVLKYYLSTTFPVLVLVCSVLTPALPAIAMKVIGPGSLITSRLLSR